ncbi:MAG: PIN domain-containing protein [Nanoarchaeota archaeon]|nr:PIN domain-containing protein [Nanoarchaeota archaeon]
MKFLDSNIIAYAFYQNIHQDNCQNILRNDGMTNTIALAEAFNIIEFEADRDTAMAAVRGILRSNLEIIDVDVNIIFETLKRGGLYKKLKFIDLLHYTVASLKKCESIVSYDTDFDNLEIIRVEE